MIRVAPIAAPDVELSIHCLLLVVEEEKTVAAVVSCDLHSLSRVAASVPVVWEARLQDLQTVLVSVVFVVLLMATKKKKKRIAKKSYSC
jgi:hypothetical protein